MIAADLNRHTHQDRTVTGTDIHGRRRVIRVHNIIREDGLVFICHERDAAYPFDPEQEVEVTP